MPKTMKQWVKFIHWVYAPMYIIFPAIIGFTRAPGVIEHTPIAIILMVLTATTCGIALFHLFSLFIVAAVSTSEVNEDDKEI